MKNEIMNLIGAADYVAADLASLARILHRTSAQDISALLKTLSELEEEGLIARNKRDRYNTVERLGLIRGAIDLKRQGYGFVKPEAGEGPDVFIPRSAVLDAMDGDLCLIRIVRRSDDGRIEGAVLRILHRAMTHVVGEYFQGAVFPKNPICEYLFKIKPQLRQGLVDHTVVKAEILRYSANKTLDCKVVEILGHPTDPGIEILEVIAEHGLNVEFPEAVKAETAKIPAVVLPGNKTSDRPRNDLIFTIDGDDTKDIDDAVSLLELPTADSGRCPHRRRVPLRRRRQCLDAKPTGAEVRLSRRPRRADVAAGTFQRHLFAQSGRRPAAMSCIMTINVGGDVTDYEIRETVIRSRHQMTYHKMNKILAGIRNIVGICRHRHDRLPDGTPREILIRSGAPPDRSTSRRRTENLFAPTVPSSTSSSRTAASPKASSRNSC